MHVIKETGSCGKSLTYTIQNNKLIFTGSGEMYNYTSSNYPPWYSSRKNITSIEFSSGMTFIGNYAFKELTIETVSIPSNIKKIGSSVFEYCKFLTNEI